MREGPMDVFVAFWQFEGQYSFLVNFAELKNHPFLSDTVTFHRK